MSKKGPSRYKIWEMFDHIAPTYDLVNRLITLGQDLRWRGRVADFLPEENELELLDGATGTGDQIVEILKLCPRVVRAVGIDLSTKMVELGRKKVQGTPWADKIEFLPGSLEDLPFADNSFHAATVAFGIRNVERVPVALKELFRVLKPGGRVLILESSLPEKGWFQPLHRFYLRRFVPTIGGLVSGSPHAYSYLQETIESFPSGDAFLSLLEDAGFSSRVSHPFFLGSVSLYVGEKQV